MTVKELTDLANRIETLLNQQLKVNAYEIKAYSDSVSVTCDWEWYVGRFTITPNEDGRYTVEDEYYVEKFDTIQQIVDYLITQYEDNAR